MRLQMRADLRIVRPLPEDPLARAVEARDRADLALLMLSSYRGTVDDAGEGPSEAAAEVDRLFDGAYGAFDWKCSELVTRADALASATLVTEFEGRAFLAFSMTAPEWKQHGLARAGLLRAMARVRNSGREALDLVVTAANTPAVRLYRSLGFVEVKR